MNNTEPNKKVTMKELATGSNSEIFSAKGALSISTLAMVAYGCAFQLQDVFLLPMKQTVFFLCLLLAIPFGLREWYAQRCQTTLRIFLAIGSLILAHYTIFQATRGSAKTWSETETNQAVSSAQILPNVITYGSQNPFRPFTRYVNGNWEVLVYDRNGKNWYRIVDNPKSGAF